MFSLKTSSMVRKINADLEQIEEQVCDDPIGFKSKVYLQRLNNLTRNMRLQNSSKQIGVSLERLQKPKKVNVAVPIPRTPQNLIFDHDSKLNQRDKKKFNEFVKSTGSRLYDIADI